MHDSLAQISLFVVVLLKPLAAGMTKALAEDTEISFRIYMMGYKIKFQPKSSDVGARATNFVSLVPTTDAMGQRQYLCHC